MGELLLESGDELFEETGEPLLAESGSTPAMARGVVVKPTYIVSELPDGAISQTHTLATLVEVLVDGLVVDVLTDVTNGEVTLDAGAASRGRLTLDVVGTDDLIPTAFTDSLAPNGTELRVSRGIEFADRTELVRLGIYRIDRTSTTSDASEVHIEALDRSGRYIDAAFEEAGQVASGTSPTGAIFQVLLPVEPNLSPNNNTARFASTEVLLPALAFEEGQDRWAFCQGIATAIGCELYHDRNGVLVLRPIPVGADPVATIAEGEGGVLLGAERDWDRSPVYNRIIVTGENTSNPTTPPRGVATDDDPRSPTYYFGRFGQKPYFWSSSYISTDVQAADAASGILARTTGEPDVISFGAIVDPAREPGDVIELTRERLGLVHEAHVLDTVSIPLSSDGEMSGTTRATSVL